MSVGISFQISVILNVFLVFTWIIIDLFIRFQVNFVIMKSRYSPFALQLSPSRKNIELTCGKSVSNFEISNIFLSHLLFYNEKIPAANGVNVVCILFPKSSGLDPIMMKVDSKKQYRRLNFSFDMPIAVSLVRGCGIVSVCGFMQYHIVSSVTPSLQVEETDASESEHSSVSLEPKTTCSVNPIKLSKPTNENSDDDDESSELNSSEYYDLCKGIHFSLGSSVKH